MGEEIALFPLSSVVLFPRVRVPLHIFEPRYRQLTEHALAGERWIGMVTVPPEHAGALAGDPPVYPIGCAGVISQSQRLPDGRFHIILDGAFRFRIVEELPRGGERLYRVARIERLADAYDAADRARVRALRERVLALVRSLLELADRERAREITPEVFAGMDDEALVNTLAGALALGAPEKQGLLETASIPARYERLEGLLAFRRAELGLPGARGSGRPH
jgi:Lon protease-like protein